MRTAIVLFLGALSLACQPPAPSLDVTPPLGPVVRAGARQTNEPSGTVRFESQQQALAPLHLQRLELNARAGVEVTAELPVAFSTRGVWALVSAPAQKLTVGPARLPVAAQSLLYFPLTARRLALTAARDGVVTIEPVASVDTVGGGFEPSSAPPTQRSVTTSTRFTDLSQQPDDFSRLLSLEVRAGSDAVLLVAGACGASGDAPITSDRIIEVAAGSVASATLWRPSGPLCVSTTAAAELKLAEVGRVRRFATSSLRAVTPVTVLDTEAGVAWQGRPTESQELRVSLAALQGDAGGTHRLLNVWVSDDAEASLGACGAPPTMVRGSGVVLVKSGVELCVRPGAHHIEVKVVAAVTERSDAVSCSAARAPAPTCAAADLLGKLNCIPGLSAEPYTSLRPRPGAQMFLLRLAQPVNHFEPDGAKFSQRMLLTVRDEQSPLVLHTTGYELFDYESDVAVNFPVNELEVEHRFFKESAPMPLDYSVLTIMQSASDSHRIFEALGALFPAPWVSTGHSKGGMTALYHRRFFPCDVVGSAPYVTPLSRSVQDPRFGPWLANLGGPAYAACRGVVNDLERGVISRKDELAPQLRGTYTRIGSRTNALWAAMSGQALWGMFQRGDQDDARSGCPAYEALIGVPDFSALVAEYSGYAEYYADEILEQGMLSPYTYQTLNELGSPGPNRAHLEEFGPIPTLPDDGVLSLNGVPPPVFEPRAMADIQQWLAANGEHFLFVYGGFDPWSAAQVDVTGARDTLKVLVPGLHHGVGLRDMTGPEREQAYSMLETWLGVSRNPKRKLSELRANAPLQYRDVMHLHPL